MNLILTFPAAPDAGPATMRALLSGRSYTLKHSGSIYEFDAPDEMRGRLRLSGGAILLDLFTTIVRAGCPTPTIEHDRYHSEPGVALDRPVILRRASLRSACDCCQFPDSVEVRP